MKIEKTGEMKINGNLFCILLGLQYLCTRYGKRLDTY